MLFHPRACALAMPPSTAASLSEDAEKALAEFLAALPEASALTVRTLAHAWAGGGGELQVGHLAIRLLGGRAAAFTAGTVHAPRGGQTAPVLELCRVLLESHGVPHDAWVHWSDGLAELQHHGFDPAARFPTLPLSPKVTAAEVARLATGLRDLAQMAEA